jgi:hypothetical protein
MPRLQVVRKERAVGAIPQVPTVYEVLEEMAITVKLLPLYLHIVHHELHAHRSS